MAHDIFKVPNLITIGRLVFLVPTAYFLSLPGPHNQIYALACLTLAAVSDYLDGYFARRLNQQTRLGLILDPLSDKILAATVIILLILHRDFPLWMAAVIIGRDLLIAGGGLLMKSKIKDIPASNLTGKYSFASVAVLLVSYVIDYDFGIRLLTVIVLPLIALSIIFYGRAMIHVLKDKGMPHFHDRLTYRVLRTATTIIISGVYLFKLFRKIGWI
jgi:CDP-diacylglycerol--glycerol-3-phosphate 3-phosphatidyltransferase